MNLDFEISRIDCIKISDNCIMASSEIDLQKNRKRTRIKVLFCL